jgi:hypothetical protein
MALYTSVQSGPFDVASTWDLNAVPADGDQFNINYGHNVAVTGDIRPTNGYNNSNVYGKLHIQGSGCYLRMNGDLIVRNDNNYGQFFVEGQNSGGFFRMDPGSTLEIRGTDADQHKLYIYRANDRYVKMEIEGDHPGPETTLTADADNHATSMSFADASKFRAGDWISVYVVSRPGRDYNYYRSDESVWIHDIDGNTVYFRHFVSPTATITAFSGNKIVVDDADVFRENQKIVFGTGANRNVKTITSIGYGINTIALDSNVSGSVVGEKVYRTGIEKQHFSGDDVVRMAAVLTADSNSGSNTITVNNVNGFSVGDTIAIPNNNPDYSDHANTWDQVQDYTITDINTSTNVITFTAGYTNTNQTTLGYNVKAGLGGIVANLTRNTKIKAPDDSISDQGSFIYSNNTGNANDYHTALKIVNTEIKLGPNNNNQIHSAIGLNGVFGYATTAYSGYVFDFRGNVISPSHTVYGYYAIYRYNNHYVHLRNNTFYNCRSWSIFNNDYNMHSSHFSNLFIRCGGGMDTRGHREYYEEEHYNYMIKVGNGRFLYNGYGTPKNIYSEYYIFGTGRPFYLDRSVKYLNIKKCYYDYYRYRGNCYQGDSIITNNCWLGNGWDVTGTGSNNKYLSDTIEIARVAFGDYYRNFDTNYITHLNANFRRNYTVITNNSALKYWDENEQAWRVYIDKENSRNGFTQLVYIPDNSRVFISASVKCQSSLTLYPELFTQGLSSMTRGFCIRKVLGTELNALDPSQAPEITEATGFRDWTPFTSASKSDFETKNITIPSFPFSYWLAIGILINNGGANNAWRGWWEKDLIINIEKPQNLGLDVNMLNKSKTRIGIANNHNLESKTIWGG